MSYYHLNKKYWDRLDGKYGVPIDIEVKCTFCAACHTIEDNWVDQSWDDEYCKKLYFEDDDRLPCCNDCADKLDEIKLYPTIALFEELTGKELYEYDPSEICFDREYAINPRKKNNRNAN